MSPQGEPTFWSLGSRKHQDQAVTSPNVSSTTALKALDAKVWPARYCHKGFPCIHWKRRSLRPHQVLEEKQRNTEQHLASSVKYKFATRPWPYILFSQLVLTCLGRAGPSAGSGSADPPTGSESCPQCFRRCRGPRSATAAPAAVCLSRGLP